MKQLYQSFDFKSDTLKLIKVLNTIVEEYIAQGYVLTVRQLYYQMVARGYIENTERSYKRITGVVNDARLAGLIDWDGIEDRTREFIKRSRWSSPSDVLNAVADQYHEDMWTGQKVRAFVIVEKEALAGVLQGVCHKMDTPLLAARGYPSGTVLREFAMIDLMPCIRQKQGALIIHLGDHDPSGIDMTRDLEDRVHLFMGERRRFVKLVRIALNMDQVEEQRPPENPAKITDSRFASYQREYGDSSWELDALKPDYLADLVERNIRDAITDEDAWRERQEAIDGQRVKLREVAEQWDAR
jgi:hypothetical protein